MPDYRSNAHKDQQRPERPEKNIEKVVTGEVIVRKKSLGRKFKDLFVKADFKSVGWFVLSEKLIPAAQNAIFDSIVGGAERSIYGPDAIRARNYGSGPHPRISYSRSPIGRAVSSYNRAINSRSMMALPSARDRSVQYDGNEFIMSSKEEADLILERMQDILDNYEVVVVADVYELAGIPSPNAHVDNKWGWVSLAEVVVRQVREGWLIDFPPPDPIS